MSSPLFVSLVVWLASLDQVWTTVRDKHFDPNLGGVDWVKAGDEARQGVLRATSEKDARAAIETMLARLGHSHVGIIPRQAFEKLGSGAFNLPKVDSKIAFERRGDAGYLRIAVFVDPENLDQTMRQAIDTCRDCRGFVVDLRGNPGGVGGMASALAGWFVERPEAMGTVQFRGYAIKLLAFPRTERFAGPLAVLIDKKSMSTAEFFAAGMKDLKRARIFGERSPGMALPSVIERLPNGDGLQYPTANYVSAGGKAIEGEGIIPHQEVPSPEALVAALAWIQQENKP